MATDYLVTYDISHVKRLRMVHQCLLGYGIPLQYSVFYIRQKSEVIDNMIYELSEIIHQNKDDVRVYPVYEFDLSKWTKVEAYLSKTAIVVQ